MHGVHAEEARVKFGYNFHCMRVQSDLVGN